MKRSLFAFAALIAGASLCGQTTFVNSTYISVPDQGTAVSSIQVSGFAGSLSSLSVSLNGLSHEIPDDLQIVLVGSNGNAVTLADFIVADGAVLNAWFNTPVTLTFSDTAPQRFFTDTGAFGLSDGNITGGVFRPLGDNLRELPAAINGATVCMTFQEAFSGSNPNGTWTLYVRDVAAVDVGFITNGWSLSLTAVPEPATYGVVTGLIALIGVVVARRGRRSV